MPWLADLIYLTIALLTAPIWLWRMTRTGKIRTDWRARLGRSEILPAKTRPRILIHAVSVGEVNAIRLLVDHLATGPGQPEIVIATTTDTGFARAKSIWSARRRVVRYPFDLSFAVRRFLDAVRPDVVALVELEVWPGFTAECQRRAIPVCVINGRLTERSFKRYRNVARLMQPSFRRLAFAAVQDQAYADRFVAMGVPAARTQITGTLKWDAAQIADDVPGSDELARAMGIDRSKPLIVAGSTAPGEHELLMNATPSNVQLLCAPRKPEWFEQAAGAMPGCVRRSQTARGAPVNASAGRFLLDSIGELRQAYALADLVVIGRSFGALHGSDMMEPIALGKPTVVGPAVADFQQTMNALLAGDGIVQTSAEQLPQVLRDLLNDSRRRAELVRNGREVIRVHQGATRRTAELIMSLVNARSR